METIISTHVILDGEEKWFKLIWLQWFYFNSCDGCGWCDSVCAVKLSDMPAITTINFLLLNVNIWSVQSSHTVQLVWVASILVLWLTWVCSVHSQWCVETCRLTFIDCHTPHIHVLDVVSWLCMCVSYNFHFHLLRLQMCVCVCFVCCMLFQSICLLFHCWLVYDWLPSVVFDPTDPQGVVQSSRLSCDSKVPGVVVPPDGRD